MLGPDLASAGLRGGCQYLPDTGRTELYTRTGRVYVIASQAQNHTESYTPNPEKDTGIPVDLSGADFELADNDAAMSGSAVDNPKVPNLTKVANSMPGGVTAWMHPYGIRPLFLFDASGIEWSSFKSQNGFTYNDRPKRMPPFRNIRVTRFLRT